MTRADQILEAVVALIGSDNDGVFSVRQIRTHLGVQTAEWTNYSPALKGMLEEPGTAPRPRRELRGLLRPVARGRYALTPAGRQFIQSLGGGRKMTSSRGSTSTASKGPMRQVFIYRGEDNYWIAECPSLPGCVSQAVSKEEAIANIREAIRGYVAALEEDNLSVPREQFEALLIAV